MQNTSFNLGQIVLSKQGRDKGQCYVVVGFSNGKVLVADGKYKLLEKPKSKNALHLKCENFVDDEISTKLQQNKKINNQMIYHTLYEYQKSKKGS